MPFTKLFVLPLFIVLGLQPFSDHHQHGAAGLPGESVTPASAQELFRYLRCHRQAKNIVINWGTNYIEQVQYFVVYHSEDGEFFDPIEEVWPDGELKYSHKHLSVFPGYHHYYISAVMFTGPAVNSAVDIVRIVGH